MIYQINLFLISRTSGRFLFVIGWIMSVKLHSHLALWRSCGRYSSKQSMPWFTSWLGVCFEVVTEEVLFCS